MIRDSYDADSHSLCRAAFGGFPWRLAELLVEIRVEKSSAEAKIPIPEMQTLTIMGCTAEGKPEVSILKKDGTELTLPLLAKTRDKYDHPNEYGPFDGEDAIVVPLDEGYEGISLVPMRHMTVSCKGKGTRN